MLEKLKELAAIYLPLIKANYKVFLIGVAVGIIASFIL
jgi:hypothetical protein